MKLTILVLSLFVMFAIAQAGLCDRLCDRSKDKGKNKADAKSKPKDKTKTKKGQPQAQIVEVIEIDIAKINADIDILKQFIDTNEEGKERAKNNGIIAGAMFLVPDTIEEFQLVLQELLRKITAESFAKGPEILNKVIEAIQKMMDPMKQKVDEDTKDLLNAVQVQKPMEFLSHYDIQKRSKVAELTASDIKKAANDVKDTYGVTDVKLV